MLLLCKVRGQGPVDGPPKRKELRQELDLPFSHHQIQEGLQQELDLPFFHLKMQEQLGHHWKEQPR